MSLTDQERQRIYEEERVRLEAQEEIRRELGLERRKQSAVGCLRTTIIVVAAVLVLLGIVGALFGGALAERYREVMEMIDKAQSIMSYR